MFTKNAWELYSDKMYLNELNWETSAIDWCEENYFVSVHVVEFWNTVCYISLFLLISH